MVMKVVFAPFAALAAASTADAARRETTSSFVVCDTKVDCNVYKKDPKTHSVMRCKPRGGTTQPCTTDYCCAVPPSYVPCNTVVTCLPGSTYKTDPKTNGVLRCKPRSTSNDHCTYDYCCKPFYYNSKEVNYA